MLNTMTERDRWSAPERAWRIASQNYQLLTMLEVLEDHTSADADHLALATRLTLAFPAETSLADRELPIDAGARTRDALAATRTMALALGARAPFEDAEPASPDAMRIPTPLLRDMADACQSLLDWVALHDEAFEQLDPPDLAAAA